MKSLFIEDMNWVDVEYLIKTGYKNIIVGISSVEQHGPHLPLKTDVIIAEIINTKVAIKIGKTLIGPTIKIGCSENHLAFPGTITLGKHTFQSVIMDYIFSISKHGFQHIIIIPSQQRNYEAMKELHEKYPHKLEDVSIILFGEFGKIKEKQLDIASREKITTVEAGLHAGEIETSIMLNISPGLVKTNRFEEGYKLNGESDMDLPDLRKVSANGIIGDSTKSNSRRGELYLNSAVDIIVDNILKQLK